MNDSLLQDPLNFQGNRAIPVTNIILNQLIYSSRLIRKDNLCNLSNDISEHNSHLSRFFSKPSHEYLFDHRGATTLESHRDIKRRRVRLSLSARWGLPQIKWRLCLEHPLKMNPSDSKPNNLEIKHVQKSIYIN